MAKEVRVPDVGDAAEVEVIEILVAVGDVVEADDSLIVLESDKASMEIPSPEAGKILSISVSEGDTVDEGDLILELETASAGAEPAPAKEEKAEAAPAADPEPAAEPEPAPAEAASGGTSIETVVVPDVGDADEITVTEILISVGDTISRDDSTIVLESDKASMEIPSPHDGTVTEILVKEGDEVGEGHPLLKMEVGQAAGAAAAPAPQAAPAKEEQPAPKAAPQKIAPAPQVPAAEPARKSDAEVYAGPAVRKQARQYGVDLAEVKGSGRGGRVLKEDVQNFVKERLAGGAKGGDGAGIPAIPVVDFSKFGEVSTEPMSRIRRASARNLHRSWLNVPHVTQFDEADVTELEAFRKQQNAELSREGKKLTPLAFLVKAVAHSLKQFPHFNSSLDENAENFIIKHYYHIGIAVETEDGLVVPVLKDADKKGVLEIAEESADLAAKARDKKLPLDAMSGATFSISSLGGIGGTAFTPIVNAPEVAILGVSRTKMVPMWNGSEFEPRTMLPLSLSYDHRAIDGAEAARFVTYLSSALTDVRRLIL